MPHVICVLGPKIMKDDRYYFKLSVADRQLTPLHTQPEVWLSRVTPNTRCITVVLMFRTSVPANIWLKPQESSSTLVGKTRKAGNQTIGSQSPNWTFRIEMNGPWGRVR